MAFIFTKKWREERKQQIQAQLKADAMEKIHRADYASKNDKQARREACLAVLKALARDVELDPTDPVFQRFYQKSWKREIERLCKEPLDARTKFEHAAAKLGIGCASPLALVSLGIKIGSLLGNMPGAVVGGTVGFIAGLLVAGPLERFCTKLTTNAQEKWEDFYDAIPDGGNGRSRGARAMFEMSQGKEVYQQVAKSSHLTRFFKTLNGFVFKQPQANRGVQLHLKMF